MKSPKRIAGATTSRLPRMKAARWRIWARTASRAPAVVPPSVGCSGLRVREEHVHGARMAGRWIARVQHALVGQAVVAGALPVEGLGVATIG